MAQDIAGRLEDLKSYAVALSEPGHAANVLVLLTLQNLARSKVDISDMSRDELLCELDQIWQGPAGALVRSKMHDQMFDMAVRPPKSIAGFSRQSGRFQVRFEQPAGF